MTLYNLPPIWDSKKFALRYGLNFETDFYINGEGRLVVFPTLLDDPPIFELPDPPGPTKEEILEQRLSQIEARLSSLEVVRSRIP